MREKDYLKEEYHKSRHWLLKDRSDKIIEYFNKYVDKSDTIMELGCSSGRNMVALKEAGFKNIVGLEMSDDINPPKDLTIIKGRWEYTNLNEYDIIFSASFLQEFLDFPQELFNETLKRCRKYFMIFGDYMSKWELPDEFIIVEQTEVEEPFSQPIIICKRQ